jgi:phosphoheptose isomerase
MGYLDEGSKSFAHYCKLLLESLNSEEYKISNVIKISAAIKHTLMNKKNIFIFGNGGSGAISAYFADGLLNICDNFPRSYGRIYDISSCIGNINCSISNGSYKNEVFTMMIKKLGICEDDILVGISSSGNSGNIIHPFINIPRAVRIGILGFGDGGHIGRNSLYDIAVIVPGQGTVQSYQRAEDGQRIAVSSILYSILGDWEVKV